MLDVDVDELLLRKKYACQRRDWLQNKLLIQVDMYDALMDAGHSEEEEKVQNIVIRIRTIEDCLNWTHELLIRLEDDYERLQRFGK